MALEDLAQKDIERLLEIRRAVSIPIVAIGGISAANIGKLAGSGIDGVSVISAIFAAPDPAAAARELRALSEKLFGGKAG